MDDDSTLYGTVAVVTGAAGGIGRAVALALAAAGAKIVVNDVGVALDGREPSDRPANDVVQEITGSGGEAVACFESVATMEGGRRAVETAIEAYGRLDTLVCSAGILRPASIFDMIEADWDDVIGTNLKGHFTTIQPASRIMRDQGSGTILTFTSSGGLEGNPLQPNYSATKEGVIGLTRAVALSLAPYATCNAISPSGQSRMTDRMLPEGRTAPNPDLVAPLAVFLASAAARHITGQVIAIGGERVALYPQPRPVRSAFRPGGWTAAELAQMWPSTLHVDPLVRYERYVSTQ